MIGRRLPRSEWPRLQDVPAKLCNFNAATTDAGVVTVEDAGQIVGVSVGLLCVHWDGAWIDPTHQKKGAVARLLRREMHHLTSEWKLLGRHDRLGPHAALTTIVDPGMMWLSKHAQPLGATYLMPLTGKG